MWRRLVLLLEMIRFSHTLFALPFALLSAVMAWTAPADPPLIFRPIHLLGILVAMVGARSAAMSFNRLVDWRIDALNPRTESRHLPSGKLSVTSAIVFFTLSVLIFVASTLLFLPNYLPVILAFPVLVVLLAYSYTKRFTSLSHFWLGAALMLAPICVWIAIRGEYVMRDPADMFPAVILGLAVLTWVAGFDIIYACQDYEFDRALGLRSMPAVLGIRGALRLASICHFATVLLLAVLGLSYWLAGPDLGLNGVYAIAVALIAGLLVFEHRMVSPRDLSRVNQAFFNVNAIISIGLFVTTSIDLIFV